VADKPRALALVDALFRSPVINAAVAARNLGVSDPTARTAIWALEDAGLLQAITGRAWGKVWRAGPVLDLLDRPL
jgi:Fic family protein